jgi:hypothetical protein
LQAYLKTEAVEHFAKIMLVTQQLGRQETLSPANIRKLVEARGRYEGSNSLASMPAGPLRPKHSGTTESASAHDDLLRDINVNVNDAFVTMRKR